jgi:hypothetical protein
MATRLNNEGCMRREASVQTGHAKTGSITVFLVEELGDARVRCEQLKKYMDEATGLIEKSPQKDHFFEVAGHLMHGIPEVLMKLEKALQAASMAASRIDYEEIKEQLKPEKVEELEKALEDIRIRRPHRSEGKGGEPPAAPPAPAPKNANVSPTGKDSGMNAKIAAQELMRIADQVEQTGQVPMDKLVGLIARLEHGRREASATGATPSKVAGYFRALAENLVKLADDPSPTNKPSRFALAQSLRRVVADQMPMTSAQVAAQIYQQSNSREDVMKGFKESNPTMSQEDLEKAADMWEKHKDVVKDKHQ